MANKGLHHAAFSCGAGETMIEMISRLVVISSAPLTMQPRDANEKLITMR
jgi:hypothetical protein